MTDLQETIRRKGDTYAQIAQGKMEQWREDLSRLEDEIEELPDDYRSEFLQQLAALKLNWQQVEAKFSAMNLVDEARWEQARTEWQETAVAYQVAFHDAAGEMAKVAPLGWLQTADLHALGSDGWAQGLSEKKETIS